EEPPNPCTNSHFITDPSDAVVIMLLPNTEVNIAFKLSPTVIRRAPKTRQETMLLIEFVLGSKPYLDAFTKPRTIIKRPHAIAMPDTKSSMGALMLPTKLAIIASRPAPPVGACATQLPALRPPPAGVV